MQVQAKREPERPTNPEHARVPSPGPSNKRSRSVAEAEGGGAVAENIQGVHQRDQNAAPCIWTTGGQPWDQRPSSAADEGLTREDRGCGWAFGGCHVGSGGAFGPLVIPYDDDAGDGPGRG